MANVQCQKMQKLHFHLIEAAKRERIFKLSTCFFVLILKPMKLVGHFALNPAYNPT